MKPSIPPLAKYVLVGLVLTLMIGGVGYWVNVSSQVRLDVKVLKVRAVPLDDAAALAVVDFRVKNSSSAVFQLKRLTLTVTTADGKVVEGLPVAQVDLDRVLGAVQAVGPRYTETLKERDRLGAGSEQDRTAAGSFSIAESALVRRKSLVLKFEDADGAIIEVAELRR